MKGPSNARRDLPWASRLALAALAVGGSVAYAASFRDGGTATSVALAAGISWPVFGAAVLLVARGRPSPLAWADACLATMGIGIAVLLVSALLDVLDRATPLLHVLVLVASNAAMAAAFVFRARALGMRATTAAALWVLALDVPFLLLLGAMS